MIELGELPSQIAQGSAGKLIHFKFPEDKKSVSEMFGDKIIDRAPDKMIDMLQGNLLLAYRDLVIYCNINQYGVEDTSRIPAGQDPNFVKVDIQKEQLQFLDLHEDYKIICIQDIGNKMSAFVLEDLQTR